MSTFSAPLLWLASVLSDPATGVNAMIAAVPHTTDFPRPPDVEVFNGISDDWVSFMTLPESIVDAGINGLIVRRLWKAEADVLPAGNGFDAFTYAIHLVARVAAGGTPRSEVAIQVDQQLRCARRAISRAMPDFVQATYPTFNGVEIGVADQNTFSALPIVQPIDASLLHDGYVVRLAVHDAFALGI